MKAEEIKAYCLSKKHVVEGYPFGEVPVCYRIGGKIFAQLFPDECSYKNSSVEHMRKGAFQITLRCEPEYGQFMRQLFPEVIVRGYHCPPVQQPYFNTVKLSEFKDDQVLLDMIDHSYEACMKRLPKKTQKELSE